MLTYIQMGSFLFWSEGSTLFWSKGSNSFGLRGQSELDFPVVRGMKFLGYSFYVKSGECRLSVHPKSYAKLKLRLKELTGRSNGMGYEQRKTNLRLFIQGWLEYFKLADMKSRLQYLDTWYRRRLRMCIWKCWKKVKTRFTNLCKCGIDKRKAWEWANTRKGYWHISNSYILARALCNDNLRRASYPFLLDCYRKVVS